LAERTKLAAFTLVDAERPDLERIENEHAVKGLGRSGALLMARHERRLRTLEELVRERIRLEKDEAEYPLAPEDEETWNDELLETIMELTKDQEARLRQAFEEDCRRILGSASETLIDAASDPINKRRLLAIREVEIMKDERAHRKEATPPPAPSSVTLNISHSQIAGLNIGGTVGSIEATVNNLQTAGSAQLAEAIKKLAEAIPGSDGLKADDKRGSLELVSAMGDELARPPEKRRLTVLRNAARDLKALLVHTGELYAMYEGLKPIVKAATGVDLP